MMDAISDSQYHTVVLYTSARIGKTSIMENATMYYMEYDPCPILMVQPTVEDGQDWSKDSFATMLRDNAILHGKVKEARSKDSSNTILHKSFPGGFLKVVGANSARGFRRTSIRLLLLDEIDGYPPSAGQEGDPVTLAITRTTNVWNKKIIQSSTPTIRGMSRVELAFKFSNQQHYFVPCPKCNQFQKLVYSPKSEFAEISHGSLRYEQSAGQVTDAWYECEKCSAHLDDADKHQMISRGKWRSLNPDVTDVAGFHISQLYSPWVSFQQLAQAFIEAQEDRSKLRTFINTKLGETWEEEQAFTISDQALVTRREKYTADAIPAGILILTSAVDVQDDRLECKVKGWGLKEESWLVGYKVFIGRPDDESTWDIMDTYLDGTWARQDGFHLTIQFVCVDSGGHFSQSAYKYVNRRRKLALRYVAIKGYGGRGRIFIGKMSRNNKERCPLVPLGVDDGKQTIHDRLQITTHGAGYMHFCDEFASDAYFKGLTSEKKVIVMSKGFPTVQWKLKSESQPNEPFDLEVYNLAAIRLLNANMDKVAENQSSAIAKLKTQDKPKPVIAAAEPSPRPFVHPYMPRKKSWLKNY